MLFVCSTSIVHEVCPIDLCLDIGCNYTLWIYWDKLHTTYISFPKEKGPHVGVHKECARNYDGGRECTLSFNRTRTSVWTWPWNKNFFCIWKPCKETEIIYMSLMVGETHMYSYNSHNEWYCVYLFGRAISTLKPQ